MASLDEIYKKLLEEKLRKQKLEEEKERLIQERYEIFRKNLYYNEVYTSSGRIGRTGIGFMSINRTNQVG